MQINSRYNIHKHTNNKYFSFIIYLKHFLKRFNLCIYLKNIGVKIKIINIFVFGIFFLIKK